MAKIGHFDGYLHILSMLASISGYRRPPSLLVFRTGSTCAVPRIAVNDASFASPSLPQRYSRTRWPSQRGPPPAPGGARRDRLQFPWLYRERRSIRDRRDPNAYRGSGSRHGRTSPLSCRTCRTSDADCCPLCRNRRPPTDGKAECRIRLRTGSITKRMPSRCMIASSPGSSNSTGMQTAWFRPSRNNLTRLCSSMGDLRASARDMCHNASDDKGSLGFVTALSEARRCRDSVDSRTRSTPTGKSVIRSVIPLSSPLCKNISVFPKPKSGLYDSPSHPTQRGVS
jgi:hypothetical protein